MTSLLLIGGFARRNAAYTLGFAWSTGIKAHCYCAFALAAGFFSGK